MHRAFRRIAAHPWLPALLPACAAVLVYAATLRHGYVRWDDPQLITENMLVRGLSPRIFWSYDPELYIPFTLLTYQVEYLLSGGTAWMAHLTNVLLHAANAALAWALIARMTRRPWIASGAALLFAVHPLTTEAVAWASGRKELLWTFWSLVTTLLFLRGATRWTAPAMVLAVLSKPTAIVTPVLARLAGGRWRALGGCTVIAIAGAAVAFGGKAQTAAILSPVDVSLLAIRSVSSVLARVFWPMQLSPLYTVAQPLNAADAALPACALIAYVATAWLLRRHVALVWTGLLWFAAALAPSLLTYLRSNEIQLAADRYAYMPLIGIAIAAAGVLALLAKRAPAATGIAVMGAAIVLGTLTHVQAGLWRDSPTLFAAAVERTPLSAVAWNNNGDTALSAGDLERAEHAIATALTLRPDYADALANMGAIRGRQERYDEAEHFLTQALSLKPEHLQATFNLAGVLWKRGKPEEALVAYRRVLELHPGFAPALAQIDRIEDELR